MTSAPHKVQSRRQASERAPSRQTASIKSALSASLNASPSVRALVQFSLALNAPKLAAGAPPPSTAKAATGGGVKLPDRLRLGVQALARVSMDDVRVHYRAPQVAAVRANAYTQGLHIYIGPGQERHLPHEAWHAAQQKQGRVKPTLRENGFSINADASLEREAILMGARAAAYRGPAPGRDPEGPRRGEERAGAPGGARRLGAGASGSLVIQRDLGADNQPPAAGGAWAGPFYRGTNAAGHTIRPPWVGHWGPGGGGVVGAGQQRNHVISHHHIAESLTNLLNLIYTQRVAAPGAVPAAVAQLTSVTASLFPAAAVPAAAMVVARTAAVNAIYAAVGAAGAGGAPAAANSVLMAAAATSLESHLTSSQDNVRAANGNLNQRIGNNVDPQYAGLIALPAFAAPAPVFLPAAIPVPAPWAVAGGAGWGTVAAGAAIPAAGRFYCMIPAHNQIVWHFMNHATPHMQTNLTVVRNDDPANVVPAYSFHAPLSSSGDPAAGVALGAGSPVLIFDPAGVALPQRFA